MCEVRAYRVNITIPDVKRSFHHRSMAIASLLQPMWHLSYELLKSTSYLKPMRCSVQLEVFLRHWRLEVVQSKFRDFWTA